MLKLNKNVIKKNLNQTPIDWENLDNFIKDNFDDIFDYFKTNQNDFYNTKTSNTIENNDLSDDLINSLVNPILFLEFLKSNEHYNDIYECLEIMLDEYNEGLRY